MTAKQILKSMTLEDKARQLTQFNSLLYNPNNMMTITGPKSDLGITDEDIEGSGSGIYYYGDDEIHRVQNGKLTHKIPLLFMVDIIHGSETIYPIPLAMGATFDPTLMKECAAMAAREAKAIGIDVTFAPMVDFVRDARWGRVMESTGEDVYLNCLFAKAQVEGFQSEGLVSCVKHFAAYGAPEGGVDYNAVDVSEWTLREKYLPAYKAAIDAGAKMVMTSFNSLNGVPSVANKRLVKGILRDEWGFDGIVISDYNAFRELISHGVAKDEKECAYKAMQATIDIEMLSACYIHSLKDLIREGKITETQVDEAVLRVLKLKEELGLLDKTYTPTTKTKEEIEAYKKSRILTEEHRALARKAAEKSAVLLKNDGLLPLDKESVKSVAVIGPFGDTGEILGAWRAFGDNDKAVKVTDGLKNLLPNAVVRYAKGVDADIPYVTATELDKPLRVNEAELDEAVRLASSSDVVVLTLGETQNDVGEGNSKQNLELSEPQKILLEKVAAANPNTVAVIFSGRPLVLTEAERIARASLLVWHPGTEGGNAIANLLFGEATPQGKLTMSFPKSTGQCPLHYDTFQTGRPQQDDNVRIGCTASYIDGSRLPLYPFGYGLSYTTFAYDKLRLSESVLHRGKSIVASIDIKNTGNREGTETVQLYVRDLYASVVRPVRELKGFKKVTLSAGEEKTIEFEIDEEMLKFYNADLERVAEDGDFEIYVGGDSGCKTCVRFRLES